MTINTRTFYTVHIMTLQKIHNQEPYWSDSGSGAGGRTLEEAHDRVRKDMARIGPEYLDGVTFKITKSTTTDEIVEEIPGNQYSFFMLKG